MIDKYILVNGLKIHYLITGKGQPFLFLHGHRSDAYRFHKITDKIAQKYQVIIPDLPGFGKSQPLKTSHTLENYLPFLNEFLKQLKIKEYCLGGVSLGASLSLLFLPVAKPKVLKLILVGPIVDKDFYKFSKTYIFIAKILLKTFLVIPGLTLLIDKIIRNDWIFKKINWLTLPVNFRQTEVVDYEVKQWRTMRMRVWAEICLSMLNFKLDYKKSYLIDSLFVLAALDRYFKVKETIDELKRLFPKSEAIILKDSHHVDPGEIQDQLLSDLNYIFDKI